MDDAADVDPGTASHDTSGCDASGHDAADTPDADPDTRAGLCRRAADYTRTVPLDVDLDAVAWEVSECATRRAGATVYDPAADRVTIRLTWDAYREYGWREFAGTVRHELVHAWEFQRFGESGHGERFRRKAREVDAPRHCRPFTDARLRLVCTAGCGWTADRHRASRTVRRPDDYRCGDCSAPYRVEHRSGVSWRTGFGYRVARRRIGDDW
jgi:predicted SprT family Zn-dependent metalloprotease